VAGRGWATVAAGSQLGSQLGYPWLPGYAVSDLAVQIKSIRRDEADRWELMGRRLTVPVVQEPGSACSSTNA
jgi:hypothetical protein